MRCLFLALAVVTLLEPTFAADATLVEVRKIWDAAPHNAFTSLIQFQDRWYCAFREGQAHVSADGVLRLLVSKGGQTWESAALFKSDTGDVRDAKLTITPDGSLMLLGCIAEPNPKKHRSVAWFSKDGQTWSEMCYVGGDNFWLWRVTFHEDVGYGIGYTTGDQPKSVRLYKTADSGKTYEPHVPKLDLPGYGNEHAMVFRPDGTAVCLLRRDPMKDASLDANSQAGTALLGIAKAPYKEWTWKDMGIRFGGPEMVQLPDGRILAGGRLHEPKQRTALCWVDVEAGKLTECLPLPSGGDTSYPGMMLLPQSELLQMSYYSSHEGKTSIYLAKILLPPPTR